MYSNFLCLLPAYEADNAQWRFFCFFGVLPSVALAYYNAYWVVEEDHHGPEFEEIPGMRVRRKVGQKKRKGAYLMIIERFFVCQIFIKF